MAAWQKKVANTSTSDRALRFRVEFKFPPGRVGTSSASVREQEARELAELAAEVLWTVDHEWYLFTY